MWTVSSRRTTPLPLVWRSLVAGRAGRRSTTPRVPPSHADRGRRRGAHRKSSSWSATHPLKVRAGRPVTSSTVRVTRSGSVTNPAQARRVPSAKEASPKAPASSSRATSGGLHEAHRVTDGLADSACLLDLGQRLGTGEHVLGARLPVLDERTHGHGGDVCFVDQRSPRRPIGGTCEALGADVRRPAQGVGGESARPKKGPLQPGGFDQALYLCVELVGNRSQFWFRLRNFGSNANIGATPSQV
jgi:hypothetical protein